MAMNPGYPPAQNPGYPPANVYTQQPGMPQQTTVIVQQPQTVVISEREWSSGLFGCFEDITSCLGSLFCGPCYLCWLSSEMGEGCCMPWCVPYALAALRLKMRGQQNIRGSIFDDCLITQFCGTCALCQLKREHDHVTGQKH